MPSLRKTLAEVDSRLMATDVRLIDDLVERAVSPRRFVVSLLGGFSVLALILASLGIYRVVAYGVSQRIPETASASHLARPRAMCAGRCLGIPCAWL